MVAMSSLTNCPLRTRSLLFGIVVISVASRQRSKSARRLSESEIESWRLEVVVIVYKWL
jgi:hypothetical protein